MRGLLEELEATRQRASGAEARSEQLREQMQASERRAQQREERATEHAQSLEDRARPETFIFS